MPANEWVEIVAPTNAPEAERQFMDWEQRNPKQRARLGAKDIRVDVVRSDRGTLFSYLVRLPTSPYPAGSRLFICMLVLGAITFVGSSYAALLTFNRSARQALDLDWVLPSVSMPYVVGGVIVLVLSLLPGIHRCAALRAAAFMAGGSLLVTLYRLSLIGTWGGDMQALGVIVDQFAQVAIVALSLPLGYLYARLRYGASGAASDQHPAHSASINSAASGSDTNGVETG